MHNVLEARGRGQALLVVYSEGKTGCGKVPSWDECARDARKRDHFARKKDRFLRGLPTDEQRRLCGMSSAERDDEFRPGSDRADAKQSLFLASLSDDERDFLLGHVGLGNSQKAEVAWLERMGFEYIEKDVRE